MENFYTYDALHRIVAVHESYGNDNRGNLVLKHYGKNKKLTTVGSYVYDETNKMVFGTNEAGEVSNYIYNGLGALDENQWIIAKNGCGYQDVDAGDVEVAYPATGLKKSSTVIKQFVLDCTTETYEPLMEYEVNGINYGAWVHIGLLDAKIACQEIKVVGDFKMIVSEKEALHYIQQAEQQYEWGQISKTALEEKLEHFLDVLSGYNASKASDERNRINRKYGFSL